MSAGASLEEWVCIGCGTEVAADEDTCPGCGASNDPLQGKVLAGKYKLIRKLAGGGMGYVYLAEHTRLKYKKKRAIKILRDEMLHDNVLRKRFLREVELTHLVSQDNPHIVHVHDDYGFENGVGFYVMEYLEGDTLEQRIERGPKGLPLFWVREITSQICEALDTIHHADIVHRDLKPANIFLVKDKRQRDFVKVMDFGIAKAEHAGTQHTKEGSVIGTPQYLAPEQIRALPGTKLDARCDIYALGCILFEMLSGRPPFVLETGTMPIAEAYVVSFQKIMMKHLTEPPPPLGAMRPNIPPELEDFVLNRMLAKHPDARPQSVHEVVEAFRAIALPDEDPNDFPDLPPTGDLNSAEFSQDFSSDEMRMAPSPHQTPSPQSWSGSSGEHGQGPARSEDAIKAVDEAISDTYAHSPPPMSFLSDSGLDNPPQTRGGMTGLIAGFVVILVLTLGVGIYFGTRIAKKPKQAQAANNIGSSQPQDREPTRAPAPRDAAPAPTKRPQPPDIAVVRPAPPAITKPQPRLRPKGRIRRRRRRRRRWRRRVHRRPTHRQKGISIIAPAGYFSRYRLRFSPRRGATRKGNTLELKAKRVLVKVESRLRVYGFYTCRFWLTASTKTLKLSPLLSKSELSPDDKRYCLAR